jgi:hypothetical protein
MLLMTYVDKIIGVSLVLVKEGVSLHVNKELDQLWSRNLILKPTAACSNLTKSWER